MSKAYIRLDNNISSEIHDVDIINKDQSPRLLLLTLILGVIIIFFVYWWRNATKSETFDPDDPSNRDSFPARVDSNATMNTAGRCNDRFRPSRSILKNGKRIGYIKPYSMTQRERDQMNKKYRVRWSDPLIMIAE